MTPELTLGFLAILGFVLLWGALEIVIARQNRRNGVPTLKKYTDLDHLEPNSAWSAPRPSKKKGGPR